MVYNSISKVSSEHLPVDGMINDKRDRTRRLICAAIDFIAQIDKTFFIAHFKAKGINRVTFVFTTVVISFK